MSELEPSSCRQVLRTPAGLPDLRDKLTHRLRHASGHEPKHQKVSLARPAARHNEHALRHDRCDSTAPVLLAGANAPAAACTASYVGRLSDHLANSVPGQPD